MLRIWLLLVLSVSILTLSGCAQGMSAVKSVDQWVQDNIW